MGREIFTNENYKRVEIINSKFTYSLIFIFIFFPLNILSQIHWGQRLDINTRNLFFSNPKILNGNEEGLNIEHLLIDSIITNSVTRGMLKNLIQYNVNNKMTEWLILDNSGSGWSNYFRNVYFYDFENKLMLEVGLAWNMTEWDSLTQIEYIYSQGNVLRYILQSYTANGWENTSRTNYEYDTLGNVKKIILETWINNDWQNSDQASYFYRYQNLLDSILFKTWDGNAWQNYIKSTFYYIENREDADSIITKSWTGTSWLNYMKRLPKYDLNHNQIEVVDQIWSSDNWENSVKVLYSYNQYNYIETAFCKIWQNQQWIDGDDIILFANPDGFRVGFFSNRVFAYYSPVTSIDENMTPFPNEYYLYQNYPNPFNPATTINYQLPQTGFVTLKIYDILGKEVATIVNEQKSQGRYSVNFNAARLASGVYLYQIRVNDFVSSKKMLLLK